VIGDESEDGDCDVNVNVIYLLSTSLSIIKQHAQLMSWTARQHITAH